MMPSCRSTSVWLRRDRLTNIAFRLPRSLASWAASRTASWCTWSKARATSPISSVEVTPIGSISTLIAGALALAEPGAPISGSRWLATSSASRRSLRSGRIRDRATTVDTSTTKAQQEQRSAALVTSRSEVAWDRSAVARAAMPPATWPAT